MSEVHKKHPCRKDCPKRDGECHAKCPDYQAYEQDKLRRYDETKRRRESLEMSHGAMRNVAAFDRAYQEGRRTYGK